MSTATMNGHLGPPALIGSALIMRLLSMSLSSGISVACRDHGLIFEMALLASLQLLRVVDDKGRRFLTKHFQAPM
jgi:hypothetical protein